MIFAAPRFADPVLDYFDTEPLCASKRIGTTAKPKLKWTGAELDGNA